MQRKRAVFLVVSAGGPAHRNPQPPDIGRFRASRAGTSRARQGRLSPGAGSGGGAVEGLARQIAEQLHVEGVDDRTTAWLRAADQVSGLALSGRAKEAVVNCVVELLLAAREGQVKAGPC